VRFEETRRETLSIALAFLLISSSVLTEAQPALEQIIHVEIAGLRNDKGQVLCALFLSPADFPMRTSKAVAHRTTVISNRHAVCEFLGVTRGTYAVSVIHDENSNGKLDTNFLGIPREGIGASNDAKGHFAPPKFDAAAFRYPGGRLDVKIMIDYL
jgi:uncharacterized protein (DUF2141 family)